MPRATSAQHRPRFGSAAALLLVAGALGMAACSGDDDAAGGGPSAAEGGAAAVGPMEFRIDAAKGADVELPGGALLVIPPGALEEDITLTIRVPEGQDEASRVQVFELGPAGLHFDPPATLRVRYTDVDGEEPLIRALHQSDENPLEDQGSEQSTFAELTAIAQDPDENTVDYRVDHFTFFWVAIAVDDYAYLVPQIPARYLLPGDLLLTLTSKPDELPSWVPGHVGVLTARTDTCAEQPAGAGEGDRIIESTPPKVQRSTLRDFVGDGGHIFMGARRPGAAGSAQAKEGLTDQERDELVDFLGEQVGEEYSLVLGQGNVGDGQWSCVGLAEAAYDSIDRGVLNGLREGSIATPIEMYWNTHPVDSIDVRVGGEVRIDYHGVVVHPDSPSLGTTLRGGYCRNYPCVGEDGTTLVAMELEGDGPPGATFDELSGRRYRFAWTPQAEHANQSFELTVRMDTSPSVSGILGPELLGELERTSTLTLNVVPCEVPPDPACAALPPETEPARAFLNDIGVDECYPFQTGVALSVLLSSGDQEQALAGDFTSVLFFGANLLPLGQGELDQAFNDSIYECGATDAGFTLCPPGAAPLEAGDYYVLFSVLGGDVPLAAPDDYFQYAFVFDQDGDPSNNYSAPPAYPADFFDGTDRWYEAAYAPGGDFQLKASDATNGVVSSYPTNARMVIKDNVLILLVPKGELAVDRPTYRLTAFRHKGDYGMNPPYDWDGSVEPPVADGLHDTYATD